MTGHSPSDQELAGVKALCPTLFFIIIFILFFVIVSCWTVKSTYPTETTVGHFRKSVKFKL